MSKRCGLFICLVFLASCSEENQRIILMDSDASDPAIACEAEETRCENNILSRCVDGAWLETECPNGYDGRACREAAVCTDGVVNCVGKTLKTCRDGQWVIDGCPNGCNAAGTACAQETSSCPEGESTCLNDVQRTCHQDRWILKACENGCDADGVYCAGGVACSGGDVCTDGVLRSCVDGQWHQTVCPDGCADDRTCRSTGALCTAGETACSADVLRICVNGAWQEQLCPYGCDAAGKSCAVPAVCEAGVQLCESGTLKKCENNAWKVVLNCENGCLPGGNACAACNNGAVKCQNGKLSTCAAGQWQETTCQNGCNAAGNGCAGCADGAVKCSGSTLSKCTGGEWKTSNCEYGCNDAGKACASVNNNQPSRYLMKTLHSPITPYVVEQMKKIRNNKSRTDNVFIKVGDSHFAYENFVRCFSDNNRQDVTWGKYSALQPAVAAFQKTKDSFTRESVVAVGGTSTRYVFGSSPNLLAQEINAMSPRFGFFGHGSNDIGNGSFTYYISSTYPGYAWALEDYYRQVNRALNQMIKEGVIPLMSGVAPNFSKPTGINYLSNPPAIDVKNYPRYVVQMFNAVSRGIAEARQIPWFDVYHAWMPINNHGLSNDKVHGSQGKSTCDFSDAGLQYGSNQRNLGSMQMLSDAWRTVINGEAAPDAVEEPFKGTGKPSDPILITSIPFTHSADTSKSSNIISEYSGTCKNSDGTLIPEFGGEYYYKMELKSKKRLKIFVVSGRAYKSDGSNGSEYDLDVQLLKGNTNASSCMVRSDRLMLGTLDPGTYYIVVDTYGKQGATAPGEYLLGILECDSDKSSGESAYDYDYDKHCDVAFKAMR